MHLRSLRLLRPLRSFAHSPAFELILFVLVCRRMPPVADDYMLLHVTTDTTVGCKRSNKVPGLPTAASLGLRLPSLMWQLGESSVPAVEWSPAKGCHHTCPKIHKTCTKIGNQYATESEEARCCKDQFMSCIRVTYKFSSKEVLQPQLLKR